ncbi:tRNA (adenosine(37)-N6)-threonylcarbamoyltransferase complex dimerization subunit type 1 TsaB, partial [Bacteroidota bacterium]
MKHPRILHIETATNICSVALSEGEQLIAIRESDEDKSHGALLSLFMDEVLKEGGLKPEDIHAISVSKGPGSYTGLRIGVSATKGFGYALDIPVIGIDTLLALAIGARSNPEVNKLIEQNIDLLLCALLDARRMEVYSGFYTLENSIFRDIAADVIDASSYEQILRTHPVVFFGNGAQKIKDIIRHSNAHFIDGVVPSAKNMILPSLSAFEKQKFENTAYFEPYYLKDFVAT